MHAFIVPDLDGPVTGGTLYNRCLIAALRRRGHACRCAPIDRAAALVGRARKGDWFWVDSLHLDAVPKLAAAAGPGTGIGLLLHYLPSLVSESCGPGQPLARPAEAICLRAADAFLVPSPFMREVVERSLDRERPVLQVRPGTLARWPAIPPEPPVRAVVVANLVPGKRVAELLRALARCARDSDSFRLRVIGGRDFDPAYARECYKLAAERPLRGRVELLGALSPAATLREMAKGNLLLSASCMESYGMALAEARVLGLPIQATVGGHVARLVEASAGGELFDDPRSLAEGCLALARNPARHRRQIALAQIDAWPARSWSEAADELVAQARRLGPPDGPVSRQRRPGEAVLRAD
jgi:glycosyltransferase involved in cell wall biosynthesis